MMRKKLHLFYQNLIIFGFTGFVFLSCNNRSMEGMVILSQAPEIHEEVNYSSGSSWRYLPESRIVAIDPNDSEASATLLSESYYSACAPEISYDANFIIFSGQKNKGEIWQIYEMDLADLKVRQITSSNENCTDPAYLPGGRILYSKSNIDETGNTGHALFTCSLDGSEVKQITFNPNAYFASSILQDGRVLSISRELYPETKEGQLMVLRPDGTKAELFYQGAKGSNLYSSAAETSQGKIILIETDATSEKTGKLIAFDYNRPMHSRVELSKDMQGSFNSLRQQNNGNLLVSYKASENQSYGLYEFDIENKVLKNALYLDEKFNAVEAFKVEVKTRPKKIPSEVNMDSDSGLLLCQDIDFSGYDHLKKDSLISKGVKIEILGLDSSLGIVDVEKDGSVYLKVAADLPFQIQTLDKNGNVVNGPGSWIYIRPNERRGCVGCHQGNEMVPDNKQPLAVLKEPVVIPQLSRLIVEAKVESE